MHTRVLSDADVTYIRGNYFTLEELCAGRAETVDETRELIEAGLLPAPSYVLDDGREMFPADYFVFVDQAGGPERARDAFARRHAAAGGDPGELDDDWEGYIRGIYGVCLRQLLPETIVRKSALVASIARLLEAPAPEDDAWRAQLRREVTELDAIEREFSPDYDRGPRFERPPTRDLLIAGARRRHPDVFAVAG